jgi:hypothetical protein
VPSGPFYNLDQPGVEPSEAVIANWWRHAFQGGRGLPDRIDLGVEDGQVMNAGEELLP